MPSREYTDQMRINDMFLSFFIIVLIALTILHTIKIEKVHTRLDVAIAGDVISSNIKRYIRNYIISGDDEYLDLYWDMVGKRFGDKSWGEGVIDTPYFNNNVMTLDEMYEDVGISEEAKEYFKRAARVSEKSIWKEIEAINWTKGLFDTDGEGKKKFDASTTKTFITFTDEREPNRQAAIDNVYSAEFLQNEKLEHQLFRKGFNVEQKLTENKTNSTKYSIIILSTVILISTVFKLTHTFH